MKLNVNTTDATTGVKTASVCTLVRCQIWLYSESEIPLGLAFPVESVDATTHASAVASAAHQKVI